MILNGQSTVGVWIALAMLATIAVVLRRRKLRAERARPAEPVDGRRPNATFVVGVRFGNRKGALPVGRVATHDDFVVVTMSGGAAPIRFHRSDGVRVVVIRSVATLGSTEIELLPESGRADFRLRIVPEPGDGEALASALRRSLDSESANSR